MALEKKNDKLWFFEELYLDTTYGFEVSEVLVPEFKTGFQRLMILNTPRYGKVLVLDGIVQFSEEDESIYHEYMAHWPLFSHPEPKTVLIVGGGDGGAAREILKHKSVEKVYLVDIDQKVTELVKQYVPSAPGSAFSDPRLNVHHEDAAEFIKKIKNELDVIVLDSTDPIGPAKSLFGADFIKNAYESLRDGGLMIRQTGSVILQPYEFRGSYKQIEVIFGKKNTCSVFIAPATYFGGYFSLAVAVKGDYDIEELAVSAKERFLKSGIETKWYSDKTHKASIMLPPNIQFMLEQEKYGEEIIMDLQGTRPSSFEQLKSWSANTCQAIKMLAYGEPITPSLNIQNGTPFVQYIETSAINYRRYGDVGAANIFTCASLPVLSAIEYSMNFFSIPKGIFWHIPRGSFKDIKDIQKETKIFSADIETLHSLDEHNYLNPTLLSASQILSSDFKFPAASGAPAHELIMDLYDCDYDTLSSAEAVAHWAWTFSKLIGLKPIGETNAPDFGHAKKKTAGPSAVQFFEGGSNISHYSSNWLAMVVNIVSEKEFDLRKALSFTLDFFQAQRAVCWILPRGSQETLEEIAKKTSLFEVTSSDLHQ